MKTIFAQYLYMAQKHIDTVLVTIVGNKGSAPRKSGSQMLVGAKGRLVGTIGGGAVELRSVEMAQQLLGSEKSMLHSFVLRPNDGEDIGMACGGDVDVWFQSMPADSELWKSVAGEILHRLDRHIPGYLVLNTESGEPSVLDEQGTAVLGEPVDAQLDPNHDRLDGSSFVMPLPLGERALVFGAGHVSRALVPILRSVGFRPVVFDCRPEYADAEAFPLAESVICGDFENIGSQVALSEDDYVVIMTSGHSFDYTVERQVLQGKFGYVGVIGSRRKTAAVNAKLLADGIPQEAIDQVHTPIGTAILAVTPEEIAVSIAGEMIYERALKRGDQGGHGCPMH